MSPRLAKTGEDGCAKFHGEIPVDAVHAFSFLTISNIQQELEDTIRQ